MARAWGGLVPDDTIGPDDAREEAARAQAAPQGSEPAAAPSAAAQALESARGIEAMIAELLDLERSRDRTAQMHPITFNGAQGQYVLRSAHPPLGGSVGVWNPYEMIVYLGLDGGRGAPNSHAFMVPPKSAVVVPVAVDKFEIGVDPAVLKEESATIHLLRFQAVQPLFLGAM